MKAECLALALGMAIQGAAAAQETAATNRIHISLQSSGTVFKGLPAFFAVEINNGSGQPVEFPECGVFRRGLVPFALDVETPNGSSHSGPDHAVRRGFLSSLEGGSTGNPTLWPTWQVSSGESKRLFLNLAPNLRHFKSQGLVLTGGVYRVKLGIVRGYFRFKDRVATSDSMEFHVLDFPAEELGALTNKTRFTDSAAPDLEVWGRPDPRKEAPTPEDCKALKTKELRETVALSALFHHILTAKDISTVPVKEYRPFIGEWLSPELDQIEYEILLAKGEKEKAAAAKEALLQRCPAMKFWADAAERGEGLCHRIRLRDLGL